MAKFRFGGKDKGKRRKPTSFAGKIAISLFFLAFFCMGAFVEVMTIREFAAVIGQRAWKKTPCKILKSDVEDTGRGEDPYRFVVAYEYEFDATVRTSTIYKKGHADFDEYHKAKKLADRYPRGGQAFCYVNPANPAKAVLKRGSLFFGFVILFPLIFVAVGAGGIYGTWFYKSKPPGKKRIAPKSRRQKWKNAPVVFFAIFAVVGGGLLYPLAIRPIAKTIDARSWIETPCKILSARVQSHEGDDSTTYSIDILFEYEFGGEKYKSSRYGFVGGSSSGRSGKQRVVDGYRKAENPLCYVNPENPAEAVLKRGFHLGLLIGLIPLPFFLIGFIGIVCTIRRKKRKLTAAQWAPEPPLPDQPQGPAVLKARYTPLAKLLGTVFFAVFWNGIVSVFLYDVVQGFRYDRPQWGLTIFMIPFTLIGLGAIAYVFYQFLALFNPRIRLELTPAAIPLGQAAALTWSFTGRADAVTALKIELQAREEATYRRGTKTHTAKRTFYETELVATEDPHEITAGQIGIVIPGDSMHSFEATNNKIIWELQVRGDIKKWPDVKDTFKITVAPPGTG